MQQDTTTPTGASLSALLQCLSSLDVDTWAHVLLPKLAAQGSAHDVALTCSQLRDLCFGAVQHLDLSSVNDTSNSSVVEDWVQTIPQHFSDCQSVRLYLEDEDSYHTTSYLLPALGRLPQLNFMKMRIEGEPRPLAMGTVLYSLRTQLASSMNNLRSLTLDVRQSWVGAAQAWRELGKLTWLIRLVVNFSREGAEPMDEQDLLPLMSLHNLEVLEVVIADKAFCRPLLSFELAAGLTALTSLCMSGCHVSCLEHVSSCTALRVLEMYCPDGCVKELSETGWAAVGELTGLVDLQLYNAEMMTPTAECCVAVGKLTKLQSFGAEAWSVDMLTALASCTQMTQLAGGWQQGNKDVAHVVLPSVVELVDAHGCPPFAALPNLVTVKQSSSFASDAFANMGKHCSQLRQLIAWGSARLPKTSLPSAESSRVHISTVKALSALTCLTRLDFMVGARGEVCALVDVVADLLPYGFQHLEVCVLGGSHVRLGMLMLLAKLHGLPELVLELNSSTADEVVLDAWPFLSALSGVRHVRIRCPSQHADEFAHVYNQICEVGISCPNRLRIVS